MSDIPSLSDASRARLPDGVLSSLEKIVGRRNLLHEPVDRMLYAYDAAIDRALPSAVVFPETTRQIADLVRLCRKQQIPYVVRGAATNLCGCTVPLRGALVIAPTRMKRILAIDPDKKIAVVEPGLPNLFLKKALEPYGLFYAPDPGSQKACTIGGNIGTNAGGPHCLKYGVTCHHVLALEVVLPDGEIANLDLGQEGPDLTGLMVGSEGTLGIVTQATLRLIPEPRGVETMLVSFSSLEDAIRTVSGIVAAGIIPSSLEAMDRMTVQAVEDFAHAGYPRDAEAVLLIEVDGGDEIKAQVEAIRGICRKNGCGEFRLAADAAQREKLWEGRRGSYPAMARLAPNVLVEDGAVPRNKLPEALKKIREISARHGLKVSLLFHAGDGNLHPQILFDERDPEQTARVKKAGHEMLKACVDLGGSISGEHGIGIDKRNAMLWLFTPETLRLFRHIKEALDPENLANPDKLIPAIDESKIPEPRFETMTFSGARLEPQNEEELRRVICAAARQKKTLRVQGAGTHAAASAGTALAVGTLALNRVLEHDAENFTVTAGAGIRLEDLQKILAAAGQKALVYSADPRATLGGTLAMNLFQSPPLRDQILGMTAALADGSLVRFGAKVMKNVAGYDACKLLLGSRGGLGVITSAILKTFPLNYPLDASALPGKKETRLPESVRALHKKIKTAFDPGNLFASPEESA